MFIIYKGEYVYWINGGPNFKEAKEASSENIKNMQSLIWIFFIN